MRHGNIRFFLVIFTALLGSVSCSKRIPNPELLDAVYSDLQKRANDSKKEVEEEKKKQVGLRDKLERAEPNSLEKKNAQRDLLTSQAHLVGLEQRANYYRIRAERRLLEDRVAYSKAFSKGEKWPDPREYSDYRVNTRLREVPMNWSARIPKLQDRLPSSVQKGEKKKEEPKKSEE